MPLSNFFMRVTRLDGSTFDVSLESMNDEGSGEFLEPNTGLRLKTTAEGVWVIKDEAYPQGLKFPVSILPAMWELQNDTSVNNVLAELESCGRPPRYRLGPRDWLINDEGWSKCEFRY